MPWPEAAATGVHILHPMDHHCTCSRRHCFEMHPDTHLSYSLSGGIGYSLDEDADRLRNISSAADGCTLQVDGSIRDRDGDDVVEDGARGFGGSSAVVTHFRVCHPGHGCGCNGLRKRRRQRLTIQSELCVASCKTSSNLRMKIM